MAHGDPFDILVVVVSSLIGAIVAVPGSLLFDCTYYGISNMGCSGFMALRLAYETPMVWIALIVATTVVAVPARWIAGQGKRTSV